jgi:predicted nucleotidyltransferase
MTNSTTCAGSSGSLTPGRATDLEVARHLSDRILAADGERIRRIILFGSRARGDARPDSDYDLLVVLKDLRPDEIQRCRLRLYDVLRGSGVTAEPHVMSEEEFEETRGVIGGLAFPAAEEGVQLYPDA